MSAERVAREHYAGRRGLAESIARLAEQIWARVSPGDLDGSWSQYGPQLVVGLAGAQLAAARPADDYVAAALEEQGVAGGAVGALNPSMLAGVASDGRPLDSLLRNAITTVKVGLASGATLDRAMAAGFANLDMLVRTQVADAGRAADQVALIAHPQAEGYTRMLVGKSCSRCLVLAGRWYRWSAGFRRHPRCDCIHVPGRSPAAGVQVDLRRTFEAMPRIEQDKTFTIAGAQAIREGADIARVVNARRGMYEAGGRQFTTEATTRRGINRRIRLMPEQIYREAAGDRTEAMRLLRLNGYLTDPALRVVRRPANPAVRTRPSAMPKPVAVKQLPPPPTPRPVSATAVRTLGDRVKAGVVRREVLSGGQSATTELLTLADGSKVAFKKARAIEGVPARAQQDGEELVPLVLRAAGLRAPEIYRPTANQLYMEFMQGTIASRFRKSPTFRVDPAAYDPDQRWLLGLVDQVTDNYDRNGGNFLIGAAREVIGIDHGFAFTFHGASRPEVPTRATEMPAELFHGTYPNAGRWVDNDMSPEDLRLFRSRLDKLRPEFERLGRSDWHDKMLTRLAQIERHAKGAKRRIREA